MKDFLLAALPWVVLGLTVAIVLTKRSEETTKEREETEDDYMATGIGIGMCFGVAIGSSLMGKFGGNALTYGICFGMLAGMLVGGRISKN